MLLRNDNIALMILVLSFLVDYVIVINVNKWLTKVSKITGSLENCDWYYIPNEIGILEQTFILK